MIQLKTIASEFYNEYDITTLKKKFVKAVCFNITSYVLFSRDSRRNNAWNSISTEFQRVNIRIFLTSTQA